MANMGLYSQAHQPMLQSMSAILLREGVKELYFRDFLQSCVWVDEKETGIMACMKRFNAYIRPLVLDGVQEDRVPQWDLRIYRAVVKGYFPQIYILLRIRRKADGQKMGDSAMNILLYNHSGCENRGCEAIVRSTSALFAQAGAHVSVTSGQAELDRKLNLPDVARLLDEQISPYSVSRLVNSIGFRLGMPREHEVARKYLPVIREGRRGGRVPFRRRRYILLCAAGTISGSSTADCAGRVNRLCFGGAR